jgi:hypothetical protein
MKQGSEQDIVGFGKRSFELRKPIRHNRCDGLFSRQHSRSQTIDLRGFSKPIEWRMSLSENLVPTFPGHALQATRFEVAERGVMSA